MTEPTPGRVGHLDFTHRVIDDLEKLRASLQLALEVELTTVPPYLTALYSLTDTASDAYQALRSVVVEEMFHMNQAANLLIGVGGKPRFTGSAVPKYPTYLPSAKKTVTPYVGLFRAALPVFEQVFMAIETPAPYYAPTEERSYRTIAQLYDAVAQGIETCVEKFGEREVFRQAPGTRPRSDIYLGKFGGRAVEVRNLKDAKFAIAQIKQQGEGSVDPTRTLVPDQPFGAYNHYGMRVDGTYGPILGTPFEMSHYFRFKRIVESGAVGDTYPIASNPSDSDFTNPAAATQSKLFNSYYSITLRSLEKSFEIVKDIDVYFEVTLPLMHAHLPAIARKLMKTPLTRHGDPLVGPNAAPTFTYDDGARMKHVVATLRGHPAALQARPLAVALAGSPATGVRRSRLTARAHNEEKSLDHLADDLDALSGRAAAAGLDL